MRPASHSNSSVSNVHHFVLKHRRAMVRTFSGVMLVVIAITFVGPKKFGSEAKLFVRLGRESVSLDPTATTGQVISLNESRESEINSVFESLKSREVLAKVVSDVGAQVVLGTDPKDDKTQTASLVQSLPFLAPYSYEDEAIKHLSKHLGLSHAKKSSIISISYQAQTPELAQTIVSRLVDQARETHMRVNRTDGSLEFFAAQVAMLRDKVAALEAKRSELKSRAGIANLPEQIALKLRQLGELQTRLIETESSLVATTAELKSQRELLASIPETVVASETTGMPNSAIDGLREQLFILQARELELEARYDAEHPLLTEIGKQVDAVQALFDKEPVQTQVEEQHNEVHEAVELATRNNESSVIALEAHVAALRDKVTPLRAELADLMDSETQLAQLDREISIETDNYIKYSDNLEQSRIDQELESTNISNLNVLQKATYSITPTSPKRLLNLSLGLVVAVVASVSVGVLREQRGLLAIFHSLLWPTPPAPLASGAGKTRGNGRQDRDNTDDPWSPTDGDQV